MIGLATGLSLGTVFFVPGFEHRLPLTKEVDVGYIAPSRLEITCKDLDGNRKKETIVNIAHGGGKGISYLLKEVDGRPVLTPYEVRPAEILEKE